MEELYKEIVLPGKIEVVYSALRTFERFDGN